MRIFEAGVDGQALQTFEIVVAENLQDAYRIAGEIIEDRPKLFLRGVVELESDEELAKAVAIARKRAADGYQTEHYEAVEMAAAHNLRERKIEEKQAAWKNVVEAGS